MSYLRKKTIVVALKNAAKYSTNNILQNLINLLAIIRRLIRTNFDTDPFYQYKRDYINRSQVEHKIFTFC